MYRFRFPSQRHSKSKTYQQFEKGEEEDDDDEAEEKNKSSHA